MASPIFFDNSLTKADHLVLKQLEADIEGHSLEHTAPQSGATDDARTSRELGTHGMTVSHASPPFSNLSLLRLIETVIRGK